ncbi:MAG TPA: malonate decarboxylase acyl carrier protein [Clostridia bacterium]|nr:malonate decarboxylase acyl carrier protein [Clostridia bacterium]
MNFEFKVDNPKSINKEWSHLGVVGSGDMEVLMEKKDFDGATKVKVVTPVTGFDKVWGMVLEKFVNESSLGDVYLEINDNNATPIIVSLRLRQALAEANNSETGGAN